MYDVTNSTWCNVQIPHVTRTIIITLLVHQEAQNIAIAELVSDEQHVNS